MSNYSKLPWRIEAVESGIQKVVSADGRAVCDNDPYYPVAVGWDDMEFIVRACNAYSGLVAQSDALAAALRYCKDHIEADQNNDGIGSAAAGCYASAKAYAALALVDGAR